MAMVEQEQKADIVERLRERPWCYDDNGQHFEYVPPETASEAANEWEER